MQQRRVLREAIAAVERGDKVVAQQLLAQILRSDPACAEAWLWMSRIVQDDRQRRECLRRALSPGGAEANGDPLAPHPVQHSEQLRPPYPPSPNSDSLGVFGVGGGGVLAEMTTRNDGAAEPPPLSSDQRQAGQRHIMLMGAMTFSLLCGLALLLFLLATAVPRAHERIKQRYQSTPYAATVWCPSCVKSGKAVLLWDRPSGAFRARTGALAPGTAVSVVAEQWAAIEGRMYVKIEADRQSGWVRASDVKP
jgi:hypothetical protein